MMLINPWPPAKGNRATGKSSGASRKQVIVLHSEKTPEKITR